MQNPERWQRARCQGWAVASHARRRARRHLPRHVCPVPLACRASSQRGRRATACDCFKAGQYDYNRFREGEEGEVRGLGVRGRGRGPQASEHLPLALRDVPAAALAPPLARRPPTRTTAGQTCRTRCGSSSGACCDSAAPCCRPCCGRRSPWVLPDRCLLHCPCFPTIATLPCCRRASLNRRLHCLPALAHWLR